MSTGWLLGIDLGGTSLRAVVRPAGAAARPEHVVATDQPGSYERLLAELPELVDQAGKAAGRTGGTALSAVAIGIPGSSREGRAQFVPALPWLQGRELGADLAARLGTPVMVGLDGHFTLVGEVAVGAARGATTAVLVTVGTGIGGALMVGGRIVRGARGTAGSWGWLPAAGAHPGSGHGAFEQVASGSALAALAAARQPPASARALVESVRAGDAGAAAVLQTYAARLGRGLAALASVIDPEVVLVAGGVSEAMDLLEPVLAEQLQAWASPAGRTVPVRRAALASVAGVIGAAEAAARGEEMWA